MFEKVSVSSTASSGGSAPVVSLRPSDGGVLMAEPSASTKVHDSRVSSSFIVIFPPAFLTLPLCNFS